MGEERAGPVATNKSPLVLNLKYKWIPLYEIPEAFTQIAPDVARPDSGISMGKCPKAASSVCHKLKVLAGSPEASSPSDQRGTQKKGTTALCWIILRLQDLIIEPQASPYISVLQSLRLSASKTTRPEAEFMYQQGPAS